MKLRSALALAALLSFGVFPAKDAALLKAVKTGDRVKFAADNVNGQLTVTRIEKTK